jgi:hypothetical protein
MLNALDKFELLCNLIESGCSLSHSKFDKEQPEAVDYLVIPMGYTKSKQIQEITDYLTIPICQECLDAINSDEWILLYCLNCNESQWIIKELAKRQYESNVNLLKSCPKCYKNND